jgi:hypothetical protein
MILGSKPIIVAWLFLTLSEQASYFLGYFHIRKMAGLNGPAGTGGSADAATPAQDFIDGNIFFQVIARDGLVGTQANA